jgi:hypothetical protein
MLLSSTAFSHAGSHESKDCFISIADTTLHFSGYQFQGLHPDQAYCRIFPYLGLLVIKIEPINSVGMNQQIALQLLKLNSWGDWLLNKPLAFSVLKETPLQPLNHGVTMLQTQIQQRGIYALEIELQSKQQPPTRQTFLFLAGIPITELLVIFSGGVLFVLIFIFIRQLKPAKINQS